MIAAHGGLTPELSIRVVRLMEQAIVDGLPVDGLFDRFIAWTRPDRLDRLGGGTMSAPQVDPHSRQDVAAPDSYYRDEPVWVYRDGHWREGTVRGVAPVALLVDFQPAQGGGLATDTVRAEYVMGRG